MKVKDFYEHYKNTQHIHMSHNTYASRSSLLKHNLLQEYGNYALEDLTVNDVNDMYDKMAEKGLAQNTVFGFYAALRSFYNAAIDDGIVSDNPVWNAKKIYPSSRVR